MLADRIVGYVFDGSILISFLLGLLFAEEIILFLAVLAGQGEFPLVRLFVFGYISILLIDLIWFYIGRFKLFSFLKRYKILTKNYQRVVSAMERVSHGSVFLLLLSAKFILGTRNFTMLYLGSSEISVGRFFVFNAIANFVWLCVITIIGWGAGRGIGLFLNIYSNLYISLFVAVLLFLGLYFLEKKGLALIVRTYKGLKNKEY
ncbi:MAG: membrane protein DedA with SNARE-associated domain [Patescibacteria group bacterium]|jgi:membrane protein DedA with SNARE-associated domain